MTIYYDKVRKKIRVYDERADIDEYTSHLDVMSNGKIVCSIVVDKKAVPECVLNFGGYGFKKNKARIVIGS